MRCAIVRHCLPPRPAWLAWLLLGTICSPGCNQATSSVVGPSSSEVADASELLRRMATAYRRCERYSDHGRVVLSFVKDGQTVESTADFSVAFERPNKLRMQVYQVSLTSDGRQLHASLQDFPGQVLRMPAPKKLSPEAVYDSDAILAAALTQGIAGSSVQLALLTDEAPLDAVLHDAEKPKLLDDAPADGAQCYRVEVVSPLGPLVFSIDREKLLLHKLDYPTHELAKSLGEQEGPVSDVSLRVDFAGAQFDEPIDTAAFQFEVPSGARLVEQFELPQPIVGRQAGAFQFVSVDGNEITNQSLSGKIAVLQFWVSGHQPSFKALRELEEVYRQFKDNADVAFLAVCIDDKDTTETLKASFADEGLTLPLAQAASPASLDALDVRAAPTLVVLSADGKVQDYLVGIDEALTTTLAEKLQRLRAGEDISAEALARIEAGRTPPPVAIAERSEPEKLRLTKLWECRELEHPGNVLAVEDRPGSGRLLVLDGVQTVAELDGEGQVVARHELKLPAGQGIVSFLRTAVSRDGRRWFAGSGAGVEQVHLFDDQWNTVLSFPGEGLHAGVADVQLADLDGDGEPEMLIGYWGPRGVEKVALDGERRWTSRSVENVFRMAVTEPDRSDRRQLLVSGAFGAIIPLDDKGRDSKPLVVGRHVLRFVYAADLDGDGKSEMCAIGSAVANDKDAAEENALIGFNAKGKPLWTYALPAGLPQHPSFLTETVANGSVLGGRDQQWVVAGADGSIHFLSADGTPIDRFNYGAAQTGLTVTRFGGQPVLVVATADSIEAWQIDAPRRR